MKNKQTAVEWLVEQLEHHHTSIDIKNTIVFQQAKTMEKEQIVNSFTKGFSEGTVFGTVTTYKYRTSEQYYNETYGSDNR